MFLSLILSLLNIIFDSLTNGRGKADSRAGKNTTNDEAVCFADRSKATVLAQFSIIVSL